MFKYVKSYAPKILVQGTHLLGRKILGLKNPWIQEPFHATYSNFARGVSVLISKSLACVVDTVHTDPSGK